MSGGKTDAGFRDLAAARIEDLPPRERILKTAAELFYQHGVNCVGIDRIIAESGVAKMTFYRHFPSKANLVAEYLAYKQRAWKCFIGGFTGDQSKAPLLRLLAIFDALEAFIANPEFRGCPFIKTQAEFGPEREAPEIQEQLVSHFADTEAAVAQLLKEIRPKDSKKLVQPLMSLICGTVVVAQATKRTDIAARNKEIVRTLLAE